MKFTFFETIGKLIVRYHSFFEEGIINTLIIAAFAVLFGTILGTLMASMRMSRILPLHSQAMRLVVLPQAIKNILPALGNEFVTVIKESSIVSVIGLADLMFRTNDVIAVTYKSLPCLAIAALCYFAMTFTGGRIIALAERKMNHGK